jgi:hypothetical protein
MGKPNLKTITSRSAEREALAEAIERRQLAAEHLAAMQKALREIADRIYGELKRGVDNATAAVEGAKSAATQYQVDVAMGIACEAPLSVTDARAAQQAAQDALDIARDTEKELQQRAREQRALLAEAEVKFDVAWRTVAKAATAGLFKHFEAEMRVMARHRRLLDHFAKLQIVPDEVKIYGGFPKDITDDDARISEWTAALTALQLDADARLPALEGGEA